MRGFEAWGGFFLLVVWFFFLNYAKLNYNYYIEKNKRMNKAHILAGVEHSCAKISALKDHTSKYWTEEKCQSGLPGRVVQASPSPVWYRATGNTRLDAAGTPALPFLRSVRFLTSLFSPSVLVWQWDYLFFLCSIIYVFTGKHAESTRNWLFSAFWCLCGRLPQTCTGWNLAFTGWTQISFSMPLWRQLSYLTGLV